MLPSSRSRGTVVAAGALSLVLIAPLTAGVPGAPILTAFAAEGTNEEGTTASVTEDTAGASEPETESGGGAAAQPAAADQAVPAAADQAAPAAADQAAPAAAPDTQKFDQRYDTENFWQEKEAKIQGLTLDPGDKVEATTNTAFNWTFRNDDGTLVLIRPSSAAAFKTGDVDIAVNYTPQGAAKPVKTTLKVNVVDEADTSWTGNIQGLDQRVTVDFADGTSQDVPGVTVPADSEVRVKGVNLWSVKNENGTLRVTAPGTFSGEKPEDKDLPLTITKDGSTVERTLKISAIPPKPKQGGILGGITSALGPIISALGPVLGNLKLPPLVEVHDNKVEIHDNGKGNSIVVSDNAKATVEVKDNIRDNVKDNAKATVEVKDNVKDNGKATITDNGKATVEVDVHDNNARAEIRDNVRDNRADGRVDVLPNGLGLKGSSGRDSAAGGAAAGLGGGSSESGANKGGIEDPRCVASLVGVGVPLVALVPVLLANVFRIPGFEPIQDAMKAAAQQMPGLNVTEEQIAAGVGAFTGAFALAGLVGTLTACIPAKGAAPAATTTTTGEPSEPEAKPSEGSAEPAAPAAVETA